MGMQTAQRPPNRLRPWLLGILALSIGLFVGSRHLAPQPITGPTLRPIPLFAPTFKARTLEDVQRLRAQAIAAVFGPGGLPRDARLVNGALLLPSPAPNGKLAIYHAGHWQKATDSPTIPVLLTAGYDVLAVNMPAEDHGTFASAERPLEAFLRPVALGLNHALAQEAYSEVIMTGLSGGGWTTVLYAAMDPRIQRSYPIAGSVPEYLRQAIPNSVGDYEQTLPGLEAGYLDLYVMGASEGRHQLQVFNRDDPCCFSGDLQLTYRDATAQRAAELGGRFSLVVDEFEEHELSPTMAWLLFGHN